MNLFKRIFSEGPPFKLVQRSMAFAFCSFYVFAMFLIVLIWAFSVFFDPCVIEGISDPLVAADKISNVTSCKSQQLSSTAREMAEVFSAKSLAIIVPTIIGLYCGGGFGEGIINKIKSKKTEG